jgi:hypothetical protein
MMKPLPSAYGVETGEFAYQLSPVLVWSPGRSAGSRCGSWSVHRGWADRHRHRDELVDQVMRATYPICLIGMGRPVALPPSEGKLSVPDAARTT